MDATSNVHTQMGVEAMLRVYRTLASPQPTNCTCHGEGVYAWVQEQAYLTPERPIGTILQGVRRTHKVRTPGSGNDMPYFGA